MLGIAWFNKPESLRDSIERAGVHLGNPKQTQLGADFQIPNSISRKLRAFLEAKGFQGATVTGHGVITTRLEKSTKFLYFWPRNQVATISSQYGSDIAYVTFNPDLR